MANEVAGSAAFAEWVYSGGTVNLNADFRTLTYTPSKELIDATAGADPYRQSIGSFAGLTFAFDGVFTNGTATGGTALITALTEGNTGTINYAPAGTATNSPKISFPAISQGPNITNPYADVVTISCNWALYNGTVTYSAY